MEYTCFRCGNVSMWGAIINGKHFICHPCHECCWKCKFGDKSDCKELDECVTLKSSGSCAEDSSLTPQESLDPP